LGVKFWRQVYDDHPQDEQKTTARGTDPVGVTRLLTKTSIRSFWEAPPFCASIE